ncbi:MAG: hypothetical protein EZS28_030375 [Streblomastix strix]|uniref:Uncharacterized protein n=1 Tax=Streblomastix strix TaxID=222440 RepID=A0A5J4UUL7_9EUKA|nr:MAG: hypothetical protein EZS28_030375 [Streblomastix strix]
MDSSRIQQPTIFDELQSIKKELHDLQDEGKRLSYLNIAYENQINAIQSDYIRHGQAVELEKRFKTWIDANISRSSEEMQIRQKKIDQQFFINKWQSLDQTFNERIVNLERKERALNDNLSTMRGLLDVLIPNATSQISSTNNNRINNENSNMLQMNQIHTPTRSGQLFTSVTAIPSHIDSSDLQSFTILQAKIQTMISDSQLKQQTQFDRQMTQMEYSISKRVLLQTQQFINEGNTKTENVTAKRLNQETSNAKDDVKRSIEQMKQWQKMLELQIEQLQTQFGSVSVQLQETTHRIEQSQTQQQTQMQLITQSISKIKQQKSSFYDRSGLHSDNIQQLSPISTPSKYQSSSPSTISDLFKDLQLINSPISINNQTLLKHNDSPFRIDQNQTQQQQTNYTSSSSYSLAVNAQFESLNKQAQNIQAQLDAISSDICKGRQKQNQNEAQIFGIEDRVKDLERRVIFM